MIITLELNGYEYSCETPHDDMTAQEIKGIFSRMLVVAGYHPNVIELPDGEHFDCKYKEKDE